ncbi:hypothetical protein R3P38DRAFT_1036783 [Favolaschia claudopus]|uniref:Uncharacterized protein n=1 Tax=Favolaschia claudopus TaxID=2862362 RepID=A0AAW0BIF4_9AGAR
MSGSTFYLSSYTISISCLAFTIFADIPMPANYHPDSNDQSPAQSRASQGGHDATERDETSSTSRSPPQPTTSHQHQSSPRLESPVPPITQGSENSATLRPVDHPRDPFHGHVLHTLAPCTVRPCVNFAGSDSRDEESCLDLPAASRCPSPTRATSSGPHQPPFTPVSSRRQSNHRIQDISFVLGCIPVDHAESNATFMPNVGREEIG